MKKSRYYKHYLNATRKGIIHTDGSNISTHTPHCLRDMDHVAKRPLGNELSDVKVRIQIGLCHYETAITIISAFRDHRGPYFHIEWHDVSIFTNTMEWIKMWQSRPKCIWNFPKWDISIRLYTQCVIKARTSEKRIGLHNAPGFPGRTIQ